MCVEDQIGSYLEDEKLQTNKATYARIHNHMHKATYREMHSLGDARAIFISFFEYKSELVSPRIQLSLKLSFETRSNFCLDGFFQPKLHLAPKCFPWYQIL
jgi:hypothetical protein